jgi:CRISPR-associated protein Csd2
MTTLAPDPAAGPSLRTAAPVINERYDIVYLFDVQDGNPNGDPDMANTPRFDPETFQGLVSDVALKRKIRDYVYALKSIDGAVEPGYDIFVLQGHSLESRQRMPYDALGTLSRQAKGAKTSRDAVEAARAWMCENFFDVRAFGAVMSTTEYNCGQVRGPVQVTFARSIDRIFSTEHGITRVAYTTQAKHEGTAAQTEMGNKHTVAYGLYQAHVFVSPYLARGANGTGFTEADLGVLREALVNMFDLDRSAARGLMQARGVIAFRHASPLGNAPAHTLLERVRVALRGGVEAPRSMSDYVVTVDEERMPPGVTVEYWLDPRRT